MDTTMCGHQGMGGGDSDICLLPPGLLERLKLEKSTQYADC
jgi:hypothetical protein